MVRSSVRKFWPLLALINEPRFAGFFTRLSCGSFRPNSGRGRDGTNLAGGGQSSQHLAVSHIGSIG